MTTDPWDYLRHITSARIALGRAGSSLPTRALLDFQLAHAQARDAVQAGFDAPALVERIRTLNIPVRLLDSAAHDRETFLRRPDLGRRLADESRQRLLALPPEVTRAGAADESDAESAPELTGCDLAIVVSDGLSPLAAERQAVPLLQELLRRLQGDGWRLAPVMVVRFGRVAIEDEIGEIVQARLALILLGERPGLGSPDSLGAYLVYGPRRGRTDAERNCVSNIRPTGLTPAAAATTLHYLLTEARRRKLSGVLLKDQSPGLRDSRSLIDGC